MNKILRIAILGLLINFTSCKDMAVEKPDNLLPEDKMIDIIYDIAILQAAENYKPINLSDAGVKVNNYIYKKYNIDSTTYYQNHKYYASDVNNYKKIYKKVLKKITEEQATLMDSTATGKQVDNVEGIVK
ncbi:MAG: DUF4296 domain-containing protein [Flavobacteriaceae bacterium]|nr:DUF4296 domain-containing protein [Flavobacteriaceae bacterium]